MSWYRAILTLCVLCWAGCEDGPGSTLDAGDLTSSDLLSSTDMVADAPPADLFSPDTTQPDSAPADAPKSEAAPADASSPDVTTDWLSADGAAWLSKASCWTKPPAGATLAPSPPKYSGGTCPKLKAGANTLKTKAGDRKFILVLPSKPKPGEAFPVLFMWHWLAGTAKSFLTKGEVQKAVDQQRFIAVIPDAKGDLKWFGVAALPWPFLTLFPQSRMDEEHAFFDDMLACVSKQQPVNKECISAVGVSAGALYAVQLSISRAKYLSSVISLSGGVGGSGLVNQFIRPWKSPSRKLPMVVLWGGPQDSCALLNFQAASLELEKQLAKGGHFFVECVHNCKHGEPPVTGAAGKSKYSAIWTFVFDHPYWLKGGLSPYQITGLPKSYMSWCGLGKGSAKTRTGSCPPPGCPF